MRTNFFVMIACIISILWASGSWGAAELVVGISTGYPPYYYKEEGKFKGVCIELVDHVAQQMNVKIIYKEFPWKRLLLNAKNGNIDAIMPLFRTTEREEFLYFDNLGIAQETNSFYTRKGEGIEYNGNFKSIKSYKIGVISDYSYGEKFDQYEHFNKIVTLNDKHLIEMFKHGRFDIGIGNRAVTMFYAKNENVSDQIHFLSPHISSDTLYIGFSKKRSSEGLHHEFSMMLQNFKKTTQYQSLMNKYGMSY